MKKNLSHVTVMDSTICILSLVYRIVKNSALNLSEQYFVFVYCSGNFYDSKIRRLTNISTLSTANGCEKISVSVIDSRKLDTQCALSCNEIEFSKLNIVLFNSFKTVLKYFVIDEVELVFIKDSKQIMTDMLGKCIVTPSISMTTSVSDMFHEYNIPFKFAEYFREVLFVQGTVDAKIHMKQSIIQIEKQTPMFNPDDIDDILLEFFADIADNEKNDEE